MYNFEEMKMKLLGLWNKAEIVPEKKESALKLVKAQLANKSKYESVSKATGVPWFVISIIHQMESDCNWKTHLHNGDSLSARTIQVPAGRPKTGEPPFTWEESAIDALSYDKLSENTDWSILRILYLWTKYNGMGYDRKGLNSPYVWASTTVQTKGKYVSDGVFDPDAISKRCGCVAMLKTLIEMGEIIDDTVKPDNSLPPANPDIPTDLTVVNIAVNSNELGDCRALNAAGKVVFWFDRDLNLDDLFTRALRNGCSRAKLIGKSMDKRPPIYPAAPKPTPKPELKNPNLKLVEEATKWIGVHEAGGNNHGKEVEMFQKAVDGVAGGEPWCMAFVQFCVMQVEKTLDIKSNIFHSEHCLTTWRNSPASMRLIGPVPGCIVIWQHGTSENGHTGFVTSINVLGKMLTIEGNTDNDTGVNREGNGVFARTRSIDADGDMKIVGFLKVF
jgi:uncharacterized protein (TIGR02594 family)